ncbi:ATPase [Methylocella tundrae]|uniref:ATPase n=1 Tax=Methylocella tundrae TaxID=227605 RepID=A0A8B6MB26_METTU|nr:AAA family ATPase [Methylocella tundrae]VTZ28458.1 ATPase [Methylocella tundrae]VTZ52190.1 ATPase [Methylocella tundrae]
MSQHSLAPPPIDDGYLDSLMDFGATTVEAPHPELKIVGADSLARAPAPERRWLVPGMIPLEKTTLLYGNGGDGKSLLALQLGIAVATATDWIGRTPEPGGVLMISAEDDIPEIHRRLADIIEGRDYIDRNALANLKIVDLAGREAVLAFPDARGGVLRHSPLFGAIERLVEEQRPSLVIIDTLADTFGGDEIVRTQARQFLGLLTRLAMRFELAVLVLAHPSLSGMTSGSGTSGSTGWSNSVRSRLYLAPPKAAEGDRPNPALKQLSVMKANYGPTGETISLLWDRGRFVPAEGNRRSVLSAAEIDVLFLELLGRFTREGRNVTAKKGTSYAPSEFANHADGRSVGKDAFKQAMDRLLSARKIASVEEGSPSRRRSRLVIVDGEGL